MKNRLRLIAIVSAVVAVPALGQANLLLNGSFALPGDPAEQACPTGGLHGQPESWTLDPIFGGYLERNGTVWMPECSEGDPDKTYAYWSDGGALKTVLFYQTVNLPVPANGTDAYKFSGYYSGGIGEGPIENWLGLACGDYTKIMFSNSAKEQVRIKFLNGPTPWTRFTMSVIPPSGTTQMTVYSYAMNSANGLNAVWWDDFALEIDNICPSQPDINTIAPASGIRGTNDVVLRLNGVNFSGSPTVALVGATTITAKAVTVVDLTKVDATFDLPADAMNGKYAVSYSEGGCGAVTLPNAFDMYLESLQNGGFEQPGASQACLAEAVGSDYWQYLFIGTSGWPDGLVKNGWIKDATLPFLPACPVNGSNNYGTLSSTSQGSAIVYYQTIAGQPNTHYVFSGQFAGSGAINSAIQIYKGTISGEKLADNRVISQPPVPFDWRTDFVEATTPAGTDIITLGWMADTTGGGTPKAIHADQLKLEVCDAPFTLSGMTPDVAPNTGVLHVTNLAGTGFAGTPVIELQGGGKTYLATNVQVVSPEQITCDFDLTNAVPGIYRVVMIQGTCMAKLADALAVGATVLVNGGFELPDPGTGPCLNPIGGSSDGWYTSTPGAFSRDGNAPPPADCPSPDGGHYATLASYTAGTYRIWQTLVAIPGVLYEFKGSFSAPVGTVMRLKLLDGDENGSSVASQVIEHTSDAWTSASLQAVAPETAKIITVVWEVDSAGTEPAIGGNADGFTFGLACKDPFADFDGDGDVDQVDFAFLQACFTGTGERTPECICADHDLSGAVDQTDINAFEACASGPGMAANPDCD